MKTCCLPVLMVLMFAPTTQAQVPAPAPDPSMPRNVRFDIVITDDGAAGKPLTKVVTLNVLASNQPQQSGRGQIRSSARPGGTGAFSTLPDGKTNVPNDMNLNVDITTPTLRDVNVVRVPMVVEYQPYSADPKAPMTHVRAAIDMLLESGKKTVISQSADPITDRKVIIEVTATILK